MKDMSVDYRSKVIEFGKKFIGTVGGSAPGDDEFINYYNNIAHTSFSVRSTPWCAIFQTYILRNCGVPTTVCPNFASCTTLKNTFLVPNKLWQEPGSYVPKKGDLVFFNWYGIRKGDLDHVGILTDTILNGNSMITDIMVLEGNSSGEVKHKKYLYDSKFIAGYGALNYESIDDSIPAIETTPSKTVTPKDKATANSIAGNIANFQQFLNAKYNTGLTTDGIYGPKTKKAIVKAVQVELNKTANANTMLTVDGIYGPKTRDALMKMAIFTDKTDSNMVFIARGCLYCKGYDPKGLTTTVSKEMLSIVSKYQKKNSLTVDSIVGPMTMQSLIS